MALIKIKKIEPTNWLDSISPNKIKIFAKNPLNGGIPAIEKNKNKNEKAHNPFVLNKLDKLVRKKGEIFFKIKKFPIF